MADEKYTLDPDGDVLLVLTKVMEQDSFQSPTPQISYQASSPMTTAVGSEDISNKPALKSYHFLVSSKHLTLASPVFKAMLRPSGFSEGRTLAQNGKVEISLPDDDPDMFRIILQIIHNRHRGLPQKISLAQLYDFSILVDKYQMVESVEHFAQSWITDLEDKISYDSAATMVTISWVFNLAQLFHEATAALSWFASNDIHALLEGSPVPKPVLTTLENSRVATIGAAMFELKNLIELYQSKNVVCNTVSSSTFSSRERYACDYMMLGSIIKAASERGYYPYPESPFRGLSVDEFHDFQNIRLKSFCESIGVADHSHTTTRVLGTYIWVQHGIGAGKGLNIWDFKGPKPLK